MARRSAWTDARLLAAAVLLYTAAVHGSETHQVAIEGMQFVPARVEAQVGDRIVWTNRDFLPHSVTAAKAGIESGDLAQNGRWTLTVSRRGEIAYLCRLHPGMRAVVVVK